MLPPHRPFRDKPARTPRLAKPAQRAIVNAAEATEIPPQRKALKPALVVIARDQSPSMRSVRTRAEAGC